MFATNTLSKESMMRSRFCRLFMLLLFLSATGYRAFGLPDREPPARATDGQRDRIYELGLELERLATSLAQESFDHFRGWNGTITDKEQAALFKSEAFSASCRLFLKLAEGRSDFFRKDYLRTNLYNAFSYLASSFAELEAEMRRAAVMPYGLSDCRKILTRMEREFGNWPDADNLAYLDQKYVKARDATVYLIVRQGIGQYIRRPFKSLEALYRYNYDQKRGKNPWDFLVEVTSDTLERMKKGATIDLNFEGKLIIEQSSRANRGVYLIEHGRKRGLTRPELVDRFGGWSRVYEVPRDVIDAYPEGEPIDR
jgi:hypothetical protein